MISASRRAETRHGDAIDERAAEAPSQIPSRRWRDILARVRRNISEHSVLAIAAGVTFHALLALFPAIAAFVALYGLFADPATISAHLEALSGFVPAEGLSIVRDQLDRVAAQGATRLGLASFVGLAASLWSANAGMKAIFDALDVVCQVREKRGFLRLDAISLAGTLLGMALLAAALGAMVVLSCALAARHRPARVETWAGALRRPLLLVVVALAVSALYRSCPGRDEPQWRSGSRGGAFAAPAGWRPPRSSRGMPPIS